MSTTKAATTPAFKAYSSIENHYRQEHLDAIYSLNTKDTLWCAAEKVQEQQRTHHQ